MSISKYLPPFYDGVQEFEEIMQAEDTEIKLVLDTLQGVLGAFFVRKTTQETIVAWEEQFGVDFSDKTFEERKREILSLMLGFSKLSCSKIEQIVLTKTTYKALSYIEDSKIIINFNDIGYPDEEGMREVEAYIEQLKPAHLGLEVMLRFRTYRQLRAYQYNYLHKYTYKEIKEKREAL